MRSSNLQILGIAFLGVASAQHHIEIHTAYAAPIEDHTRYLTLEGTTTRLMTGVDPNYLSSSTRTADPANPDATEVVGVQLDVDVKDGKTLITLADALKQEVDGVMNAALETCQRQTKRDVDADCYMAELTRASKNGDFMKLEDESQMESFNIEVHGQAPDLIQSASSDLSGQKEKNKFAILIAMSLVAGVDLVTGALPAELAGTPWRIEFNDDEIGGPPEEEVEEPETDEGDNGEEEEEEDDDDTPPDEETDTETTATATSTDPATTTNCGPEATIHEDSPACGDDDCQGQDHKCTKDGENKGCPCAGMAEVIYETDWDPDWRNFQQAYLAELIDNAPDVLPPTCFRNTDGDNFEHKPMAEPSAWCYCSSAGDNTFTSGIFATMTGEGDDACTYTAMPTSEITISRQTNTISAADVTSCRLENVYELNEPYCTCNDDATHGTTVTSVDGKETTVCPDFARQTDNQDPESPPKEWIKIVLEDQWTDPFPTIPPFPLQTGLFRTSKRLWLFFVDQEDREVTCALAPNVDYRIEPSPTFMGEHQDRLWPSGTFGVKGTDDPCKYSNDGYRDGDNLFDAGTVECGEKSFKCKDVRNGDHDNDFSLKECTGEFWDIFEGDGATYRSHVITCEPQW